MKRVTFTLRYSVILEDDDVKSLQKLRGHILDAISENNDTVEEGPFIEKIEDYKLP